LPLSLAFFLPHPPPTAISTLSLHDALPISIISGYRRIFPGLFKDAAAMPAALRKHVRYPELLLKLQAAVYGLYHMTDPQVFYNRSEEHTSELQSLTNLVCRLLLEKKKQNH